MSERNQEPVCNCDDKFRDGPCPVHFPDLSMSQEEIIVTDEYLTQKEPMHWVGVSFGCPKCGELDCILKNDRFGHLCMMCGGKIKIQSEYLTNIIKKMETEYGIQE